MDRKVAGGALVPKEAVHPHRFAVFLSKRVPVEERAEERTRGPKEIQGKSIL